MLSRVGTTRRTYSPRTSPASSALGIPARIGLFIGTVLVIIALAVLPLLTPWFIHTAMDAAGSTGLVGLTPEAAHAISDRTVEELVFGPGGFDIADPTGEPFYDADEQSHLRDARLLLAVSLIAGGVSLIGLAIALLRWRDRRAGIWTVIRRAGLTTAVVVVVIGFVSLVAFDSLFKLFHQVFFPGGNWSFDPTTQRLVQLYPYRFWQIATTTFGALVLLIGLLTWLLGRRMSSEVAAEQAPELTSG